ncbi:MAG: mandelate racemase/muconate lactonizing enzyme family protein [Lysobacterales bacterium]
MPGPITIEKVEILERDGEYIVRATDTDGVSGFAMANPEHMSLLRSILTNRVAPFYAGKDARDLEALAMPLYRDNSNYKWQGLPFWVAVARTEFAILDLLGKRTGKPVHELLGGRVRDSVGVYDANSDRDHSAEWVVDKMASLVAESGARAIKYKLGARMAMTEESNARDLKLIPMMRKHFGDDLVIYADANSSFDVPTAIKMGRLMEEHDYGFFEEPVPFDYLEDTRQVADALSLPIAGGEQESSMWNFEWLLANGALQVVQPDLVYFGGLLRSLKVAAMARELDIPCVPHISGRGLGSLYMAHFASLVPNTTDFQEYKEDRDPVPYEVVGTGRRFAAREGKLTVPMAPGFGVSFDPEWIAGMNVV